MFAAAIRLRRTRPDHSRGYRPAALTVFCVVGPPASAADPAVDRTQIARTLGTDGGVVCKDPNSTLEQGRWLTDLAHGAAGPGQRPVIADSRARPPRRRPRGEDVPPGPAEDPPGQDQQSEVREHRQ
jgi:hypothetical protein